MEKQNAEKDGQSHSGMPVEVVGVLNSLPAAPNASPYFFKVSEADLPFPNKCKRQFS